MTFKMAFMLNINGGLPNNPNFNRIVGYDDETNKLILGHSKEWEETEHEIMKTILLDFLHGETKVETLKKVYENYGEEAEFYADGILCGMALSISSATRTKGGRVTDCKL